MNSQTHIILGAVLFGRTVPKRAMVAAFGGIAPDIPMLLIVLVLKLWSVPDPIIFGLLYWQEWWQVTNAISHNFWLWGGLAVLGFAMRERLSASKTSFDRWTLLAVLGVSSFLHVFIDFLMHREDAHMSFWPVTRWKFISPVSYWDRDYYGHYVLMFEAVMGLALAIVLYRRFRNTWVRLALSLAMLLYAAVPAYFILG
jgi:hypothetical protein